MNRACSPRDRCGIILAAGEGRRLQPFIRRIRGSDLPKQYVNIIGTRSMLEHTLHRAERLIPPERLFTVVSQEHLKYPEARRQLFGNPRGHVILQPENKETGPGIFLPLMHLYKRHPDSVVVLLPSDHFILEEDLFMRHVDLACRLVERDPFRLVLLGIEPIEPEPEYGYIMPEYGRMIANRLRLYEVLRFIEKPDPRTAEELFSQGGLWNTMVIAFKAKTFLGVTRKLVPDLYRSFGRIWKSIGTPAESEVVKRVYKRIQPLNFSKGLLEALSGRSAMRLGVLPVRGVSWSDWGSEDRVNKILRARNPIGSLSMNRMVHPALVWGEPSQIGIMDGAG